MASYDMDHLLILLTDEKARELQFRAGSPPIMVSEEEQHSLQGPPITDEDVMRLLRTLANSRQIRELRAQGRAQFIYAPFGRLPFLVHATMEGGTIAFAVS
jgi:Tfp pilus assembly pilus retraction ATPase PilT